MTKGNTEDLLGALGAVTLILGVVGFMFYYNHPQPCRWEPLERVKKNAVRQAAILGYTAVGVLSDETEDQPPIVAGGARGCATPVLRLTLRAQPDNGHQYEARAGYKNGALRIGEVRDLAAATRPYEYHGK